MGSKNDDLTGLLVDGAAAITTSMFFAVMIYGYVLNIITLVTGSDTMTTGETVVRSIGMLFAPAGGIMGYF